MKSHAKLHWSRVLVAVVCLALPGLAQDKSRSVNAAAAQAEEAALRAAVEKFFAAYGKKDLAGVLALWSEKSPDLAAHKKTLEQQFATEDCSFGGPMISRVKLEGERVSLRVMVELTAVDSQNKQGRQERMARNIGFVKEGEEWKVWRYAPAEIDLAEALVKAKNEERTGLLADGKELLTDRLVKALTMLANRFYFKGNYPQTLAACNLARSLAEQINDKAGIARALIRIGHVHLQQGKYAQALGSFQESLAVAEAAGDSAGVANSVLGIGIVHYRRLNFIQASECFQKSLALAEASGDSEGTANSLRYLGSVSNQQHKYTQALEYFRKSLAQFERLEDKVRIANLLSDIGRVYQRQGDYAQALESFRKSLALAEEVGDQAGYASTLVDIGNVYSAQGDYVKALECLQKSLTISIALDRKTDIALMLLSIGVVHRKQGNYTQAIEFFLKSRKQYELVDHKSGVADSLQHLGSVYTQQGGYAKALECFQKSLIQFEQLKDNVGIATSLLGIGSVHRWQGNYIQAMGSFRKCLETSEAIGNKSMIAAALSGIGSVYSAQDDYSQALEILQRVLAMNKASGGKAGIAFALLNIGRVYSAQGKYPQDLEHFQKSLEMSEAIGDKAGVAVTLSNIGEIHRREGHFAHAMELAERATIFAQQIGSLDTLWQARLTAGAAYRALNQVDRARQAFADAINTIETLRTQVGGGEQEAQRFFANKLSPYLAMVDLLVAQNNAVEALTFAERAKARVLLDVLYSGRVNVSKALTSQEQEQERKSNNQLVSLNAQIYREKLRSQADQARLAELDAQLQKARLDYEAFQTNLYAAHPELRTQRGEVPAPTLDHAGALLPDAKTVLLEFAVAEDKTFLFVLTKNADAQTPAALKVFPIAIKQKELAKQTEQFRQQLAQPGSPVSKMARELFDLLFKDAYSFIKGKDKLIIVPDGPLWEMPFQALLSPRNRYLVQDHAIAYTPSLTVLREMIKLRQRKASEAPTLLAVGNPALGKEVVERRKVLMDDPLVPLPDAEKQVQSLGKFYGPRRSRIYVGAAATEGRVKAEAGQHAILHLATHGILNDRSPMYSHLVLAQTDEKDKEDGLLEAWEIMNLDLKADLAVLSACETARGRVGAGEGMIGLTWALFVAGVPTTVVSQWKVRSDSTAELMVEFHRLLQARDAKGSPRMSRAEALRQAALKLLNSSRYRHPFFWAGFVLVGDWR